MFPLFFLKKWPKTPGESKTQAQDSFCIKKSSIRANLTDFVHVLHFCFEQIEKLKNNGPKIQLFPNAPAPSHPRTLPAGKSSSCRCRTTKFHPDWTKWRPIHAHFSFQILRFFKNLVPDLLCPRRITMGRMGNTILLLFL